MGSFTNYFTGGLIDTSTPNKFGTAAQQQLYRQQALVNAGTNQINSVFDGGMAPQYTVASGAYNPKQQYFTIGHGVDKGTGVQTGNFSAWGGPGGLGKPGQGGEFGGYPVLGPGTVGLDLINLVFGGSDPLTPAQQYARMSKKGNLFTVENKDYGKGFGPDFYNRAAKAYTDYALPQLAQQYKNTQDSMTFGLANRGLLGGSANNKAMSDLNLASGQQQQQIADTGRSTANDLRKQVEAARQAALNQLYQTANPATATQGAIQTASQFTIPSSFAPLANAFSQVANQYASNQLYNPPVATNYVNPYQNIYGSPSSSGFLGQPYYQ